jgi:hypothetical protein
VNVLNLNDKVRSLDLFKDSKCIVEGGWSYGENESSIHHTLVNFMHPEYSQFSHSGGLFGAINLQIPRIYSNVKIKHVGSPLPKSLFY